MNAELITIGTELLLGQIVDTNAAWIAQRLAAEGVNLFRKQTVGDNRQRAADTIREALARADVVLTTGGIGPTVDDMTREAIADATGYTLYRDEALVERINQIFARWGREPGENNLRQADLPQGAKPIPNPIGTAPGILLELDEGKVVMAMPGVPREMKRMLDEQIMPYLRRRGLSAIIKSLILRTAGVGESTLDEQIADFERLENPTVGMAAHLGRVDIRITARAANEKEADVLIDHLAKQVRQRIGYAIFGQDDDTLEGVISQLLQERAQSVAIFETLTAGHIAEALRLAGASITHYAVGQPQSLPDEENAKARTKAFASEHNATWGLAVYSTEGDHAYGENPGESLIIIVGPDYEKSMRYTQVGADELSRGWLQARALELLRRAVISD